ncbi:MAG: hypothetical protein JWQ71_89 [Pedosphaera sp.]|nr:hypothetical protein [Pedosphaera sp.]
MRESSRTFPLRFYFRRFIHKRIGAPYVDVIHDSILSLRHPQSRVPTVQRSAALRGGLRLEFRVYVVS